jgi:hypothetical protein
MAIFKSKFFWLNLIALVLLVINYFIENGMFPNFLTWWGLAVVILNAIAGMIQNTQLMKAKNELKLLKASKK